MVISIEVKTLEMFHPSYINKGKVLSTTQCSPGVTCHES